MPSDDGPLPPDDRVGSRQPDNASVARGQRVKLGDFGLSSSVYNVDHDSPGDPATEIGTPAYVLGVRWARPCHNGLHRQQGTEIAVDEVERLRDGRVKPVVQGFDQRKANTVGRVDHRLSFIRIDRERFLAQHRLAGFQGSTRPMRMVRRWETDVDEVDIRPFDQGRVAGRDLRNSVTMCEEAGAWQITRRYGNNLHPTMASRGVDHRVGRDA